MRMRCPNCNYGEERLSVRCDRCSAVYSPKDVEEYWRLTHLRDQLRAWWRERAIRSATASRLVGNVEVQLTALEEKMGLAAAPAAAPSPMPAAAAQPPERPPVQFLEPAVREQTPPPAPPQPLLPWSWSDLWGALLSERTLTALIYLGAFMLVAAAVSLVTLRWSAFSPFAQVGILTGGGALFYGLGYWFRFKQGLALAGTGMFLVASALVPLNAVAITIIADPGETSRIDLWALASLASIPFYGLTALAVRERPFALLAAASLPNAVVAALTALDVAPEWQGVALVAVMAGYLLAGRLTEREGLKHFHNSLFWGPNVLIPAVLLAEVAWYGAAVGGHRLESSFFDHTPSVYAVAAVWWLGTAAYLAASLWRFRQALWSYAWTLLSLAALVVTVVVTLEVAPHYRALMALLPAALFIAGGEVAARYRSADGRRPGELPRRLGRILSHSSLLGSAKWKRLTLPFLATGYLSLAVAGSFLAYDLATVAGGAGVGVAGYAAIALMAALAGEARRSVALISVASGLFLVPYAIAAANDFFLAHDFRPMEHAWQTALLSPLYLAVGIVLDRVRRGYSGAWYAIAYGVTVVTMVWSRGDAQAAAATMGVALAVYLASAVMEHRGWHPALAWAMERAGPELRWARSAFAWLVAGLLPVWAGLLAHLAGADRATIALLISVLAFPFLAAALYLQRRSDAVAVPAWLATYTLSIAGPYLAIPETREAFRQTGQGWMLIASLAVSIGLYIVSAILVHRGWHPLFTRLAALMYAAVAVSPGGRVVEGLAFRSLRGLFVWLVAVLVPVWVWLVAERAGADQPTIGLVLAGLAWAYLFGGLGLRRLRDAYGYALWGVGYSLSVAGPLLAVPAGVETWRQAAQEVMLVAAAAASVGLYAASAIIFRRVGWTYLAALLAPFPGALLLTHIGVDDNYFGLALASLSLSYVMASALARYLPIARTSDAMVEAFLGQTNRQALAVAGCLLALAGVGLAVAAAEEAGATVVAALGLAGAVYFVAAVAYRQAPFLYPAAGLWAAAYAVGLTLLPLETRYLGLIVLAGCAAYLAIGFVLERVWPAKERQWLARPSAPFLALAAAGAFAAPLIPWAAVESWRDNPVLALTLAGSGAVYLAVTRVLRRPVWAFATLAALELAYLAGLWAIQPDMVGETTALYLIPAVFLLTAAGGGVERSAARSMTAAEGMTPLQTVSRFMSSWAFPFYAVAATNIAASLMVTARHDAEGLAVAGAYVGLMVIASLIRRNEGAAWAALGLGVVAITHGLSLVGVGIKPAVLYLAAAGFGLRLVGYVGQAYLAPAFGGRAALRPLTVWRRPLDVFPNLLTAGTLLAALVLLAGADGLADPDVQFLLGTLFIGGLKLSVEALWRRNLWLGYSASALLLASALLELVHFELEQPQYFAAPVALYLLAVAHLERRRLGRALTTPLLAVGLALLLGTSLLQGVGQLGASVDERYIYGFVLFAESLLTFAWGAAQRVRLTFFAGVAAAVAAVVVMLLEPLAAMGRLLLLAVVGAALLAAAAFLERKRNAVILWAREWLARLEAWD